MGKHSLATRTSACFILRFHAFWYPPPCPFLIRFQFLSSHIFPFIYSMLGDEDKLNERDGEPRKEWICWFLCTHNGICFAIKWLPGNDFHWILFIALYSLSSQQRSYRLSLARAQQELKVWNAAKNVFGSSLFSSSSILSPCNAHEDPNRALPNNRTHTRIEQEPPTSMLCSFLLTADSNKRFSEFIMLMIFTTFIRHLMTPSAIVSGATTPAPRALNYWRGEKTT